jgi:hypothetical protein
MQFFLLCAQKNVGTIGISIRGFDYSRRQKTAKNELFRAKLTKFGPEMSVLVFAVRDLFRSSDIFNAFQINKILNIFRIIIEIEVSKGF